MDALFYGQGLGGVIFDSRNGKDAEGNTLLAAVAGGTSPLSLVRAILKWGVDVNAVNCRCVLRLRVKGSSRCQAFGAVARGSRKPDERMFLEDLGEAYQL